MRDVTLLTTRQVPRRLGLADKVGRELTFSPEQESRLLAFASQPLADVLVILLHTGMRPEEVYRLQWEDVDWAGNVLRVHRGKTKATRRVIGMSTRVADVLRRQMGVKKYAESLWVFPSRRKKQGELTHIATANKAFADARRKVQLPQNLVLYATRHTFGTDVMGATGSAKLTMKSMGHVDVKTSVRYQHPETRQIAGTSMRAMPKEKVRPSTMMVTLLVTLVRWFSREGHLNA